MNALPPSVPLALGIIAGVAFIVILTAAAIFTMRNRRIIRSHAVNISSTDGVQNTETNKS